MDLYLRFSQMAREIYSEYTDKIEPYGIDEAWLDVSDSRNLKGSGITIAREISHRIKYELGVTVSIGISWNKIYAKLGSDYKKPDTITEFNWGNYKSKICIRISIKSIMPPSMSDYLKKMAIFPVQQNWKVTAFLTRKL